MVSVVARDRRTSAPHAPHQATPPTARKLTSGIRGEALLSRASRSRRPSKLAVAGSTDRRWFRAVAVWRDVCAAAFASMVRTVAPLALLHRHARPAGPVATSASLALAAVRKLLVRLHSPQLTQRSSPSRTVVACALALQVRQRRCCDLLVPLTGPPQSMQIPPRCHSRCRSSMACL
jgi:hypothetical protein